MKSKMLKFLLPAIVLQTLFVMPAFGEDDGDDSGDSGGGGSAPVLRQWDDQNGDGVPDSDQIVASYDPSAVSQLTEDAIQPPEEPDPSEESANDVLGTEETDETAVLDTSEVSAYGGVEVTAGAEEEAAGDEG